MRSSKPLMNVLLCLALCAMSVVVLQLSARPARAQAEADHVVYLSNIQFCGMPVCAPPIPEGQSYEITIEMGATVEWVFADPQCYPVDVAVGVVFEGEPFLCYHDVVSPGTFASPKMLVDPATGEPTQSSFRWTFDQPGTFAYACSLHGPTMSGTVVVMDDVEADDAVAEDERPRAASGGGETSVLPAQVALPATGGGAVVPGVALVAIGLGGMSARVIFRSRNDRTRR